MTTISDGARLLASDLVRAAQSIGRLVREGKVAPLIGAGLSASAGLPTWNQLGELLIRSWQLSDPDSDRRRLSPENYLRLIRHLFGADDLAFTSYLRRRLADDQTTASIGFSALVYRALYGEPDQDTLDRPLPNDIHRHLVALFTDDRNQLWTTNYDDLLEQAALDMGKIPKSLHIADHQASRGLVIHHLHGYLPPARPNETPVLHPVVLAEDDYHAVAANMADAAWIDHALYQLFETWHVFMVGMSLADRNVRRVLATIPTLGSGAAAPRPHFALMKEVAADELGQRRIKRSRRERLATGACALRAQHWADYGIQVIDLADHHSLLPFLVRLRYESYGGSPGNLWTASAAHVTNSIRPWDVDQQRLGSRLLGRVKGLLVQDFQLPGDEIVDVGLFLLKDAPVELELVMRVGISPAAMPGRRVFRIDPDAPSGAAGCVFVAGSSMVVGRGDAYHDYGGVTSEAGASASYAAIFQAPLVDWLAGGLPVGVLYATVPSPEATLLRKPAAEVLDWLTEAGQRLLRGLLTRNIS